MRASQQLIKKLIAPLLLLISSSVLSLQANAVELTPLYGYRAGGEFIDDLSGQKHTIRSSDIYGLIVGFPYDYKRDFEIYYSHQSSELTSISVDTPATGSSATIPLTVDYLHFGGTAPVSESDNMKTFVTGGLGFTYLNPDFNNAQSDLRASFSIGFGMKWPLSENIALRLETRGFATLFNSNSSIFCNGGCSISVNGSLFMQGEVFAGIGFKF